MHICSAAAGWCGAVGAAALARATALTHLEYRCFANTAGGPTEHASLDGPAMAALLAAPLSERLASLSLCGQSLGGCAAGDGAMAALAAARLPRLRALEVTGAGLTDGGGFTTLMQAPWLRAVTELKFSRNQLPGAALGAIAAADLPSLQSLVVDDHYCHAGVNQLLSLHKAAWAAQLQRVEVGVRAATDIDYYLMELENLGASGMPFHACAVRGADVKCFIWQPQH